MTTRRRIWSWVLLIFLAVILLIVLLPNLLKVAVNRVVIPRYISDPKIPLISGKVHKLNYSGLKAGDFQIDAGNGMIVSVADVHVAYSLGSLARGRISSINAEGVSGPEMAFEAGVAASDIEISSGGDVKASVSAQCSRILAGPFSAGPFEASTQIDGTDAELAFDVPLQDGLLVAHVTANTDWKTHPVFDASVRVPLAAADGSPVQLGGWVPSVDELLVSGMVEATITGDQTAMEAVVSSPSSATQRAEPAVSAATTAFSPRSRTILRHWPKA
jgi:hypothetical protein